MGADEVDGGRALDLVLVGIRLGAGVAQHEGLHALRAPAAAIWSAT